MDVRKKSKGTAPSISMKKRGGLWPLIRVALFIFRGGLWRKTPTVKVVENKFLNEIVSTIRPLPAASMIMEDGPQRRELEDEDVRKLREMVVLPPPPPLPRLGDEEEEDLEEGLMSPEGSSCYTTPEGPSLYGSAEDLQELERNIESGACTPGGQSYVIDMKAEEFIASFYEQMRLQRMDSVARYRELMGRYYSIQK